MFQSNHADGFNPAWLPLQDVLVAMMSAHDPGQDYTTISGYLNATQSTKMSLPTKATSGSVAMTLSGYESATRSTTKPQSTKVTNGSMSTTTFHPSCSPDSAPWYSPTAWCECGPSLTYPTIAFASNATSTTLLNCAYQSLDPSKTIHPTSTGPVPTNAPGEGGLSQCAYVLAGPNIGCSGVDYCDCGGTYVGLTTTTISSTVNSNCGYTIQPTADDCPTPPSHVTATSSATTVTPTTMAPHVTGGIPIKLKPCINNILYDLETDCDDNCGGGTCTAFPVLGNNSPRWSCNCS